MSPSQRVPATVGTVSPTPCQTWIARLDFTAEMTAARQLQRTSGRPAEATLVRRCSDVRQALKVYATRGILRPAAAKLRPVRKEAIELIRKALGPLPYNYAQAEGALRQWCLSVADYRGVSHRPRAGSRSSVAWELERFIIPILAAYRDPRGFFNSIVPSLYPRTFMLPRDATAIPFTIGSIFSDWGYGAALNTRVQRALNRLDADGLNLVLTLAEDRTLKQAGRHRRHFTNYGLEKGIPTSEIAQRDGTKVESVDRRIRRHAALRAEEKLQFLVRRRGQKDWPRRSKPTPSGS